MTAKKKDAVVVAMPAAAAKKQGASATRKKKTVDPADVEQQPAAEAPSEGQQQIAGDTELPTDVPTLEKMAARQWNAIAVCDDKTERIRLIKEYNILADHTNKLAGNAKVPKIASMGEAPKPKPKPEEEEEPTAVGDPIAGDIIEFVFAGGKVTGTVTEVLENGSLKVQEKDKTKYAVELKHVLKPGQTVAQLYAELEGKTPKQTATPKQPKAPKAAGGTDKPPVDPGKLTKMTLTKEIKSVLDSDKSGADKIREVFDQVTGWKDGKMKTPDAWDTEDFVKMSGINRSRTIGCLDKFRQGWKK